MKRFYLLIYFCIALLLSGCVKDLLTSKSNIRDFYTLTAIDEPKHGKPIAVGLIIQKPLAGPGLASEKIALKTQSFKVDYYANARWITDLPHIVQAKVIESFENSGELPRVSNTASDMQSDYLLSLELRSFQAEYMTPNAAPEIHIKIVFKLLTAQEHRVVKTGEFTARVLASQNTMDSVMFAFDQAFQTVEGEIVAAVLKQLRRRSN